MLSLINLINDVRQSYIDVYLEVRPIQNITLSSFGLEGLLGMIILPCNKYDIICMSINGINMKLKRSSVKSCESYDERL